MTYTYGSPSSQDLQDNPVLWIFTSPQEKWVLVKVSPPRGLLKFPTFTPLIPDANHKDCIFEVQVTAWQPLEYPLVVPKVW